MNISGVGYALIAAFVIAGGGFVYWMFPSNDGSGIVPSSCLGVMCRDPNDIRVERDGACHCARPVVCL